MCVCMCTYFFNLTTKGISAQVLEASGNMAHHPKLALHLLRLFGQGELSATQVQGVAASARQDGWGAGSELAERLATAGTSGAHTGHVLRDIVKAARSGGLMSSTAQPYLLKLEKGSGVVQIFLPHEIYAKMTENTDLSEWCLSNDMFDNVIGLGRRIGHNTML